MTGEEQIYLLFEFQCCKQGRTLLLIYLQTPQLLLLQITVQKLLLVGKRPVALHLWLWGFEPLVLKQRDWIWVCCLVNRCLCLKMDYLLTWLAVYLFIYKHW